MKQLPTSVVRENRTLRSEGAGGGRLPLATRWAVGNRRPYRDLSKCVAGSCITATILP